MVAGCAPGVLRILSSSRFQSMTMLPEKWVCSAARAVLPGVALDAATATAGTVAMTEMAPTSAARVLFMLFLLVTSVLMQSVATCVKGCGQDPAIPQVDVATACQ